MRWIGLLMIVLTFVRSVVAHPHHDHPTESTSGISHYLFEHRYALIAVSVALLVVGWRLIRRALVNGRAAKGSAAPRAA